MEVDSSHMQQLPTSTPLMHGILSEVSAVYKPYVEKLFSEDFALILQGLKDIKNFVIGNNKQKTNFIVLGVIPRLVYLIQPENTDVHTKTQCAVILGSLAKGMEANVKSLLDYNVMDVMFYGLQQADLSLYEACLRCVRTIASSPAAPTDLIVQDAGIMSRMLHEIDRSTCAQECTCEIVTLCCKTQEQQTALHELGAVRRMSGLLASPLQRVKLKALKAIAVLCDRNFDVCDVILATASKDDAGESVVSALSRMMSRSEDEQIQLHAARCLTHIYRSGAMKRDAHEKLIFNKTLPCLVRMCGAARACAVRVTAACAVARLIEAEPRLQRLALICEQFPRKLDLYFRPPAFAADTPKHDVDAIRKFKDEMARGDDLTRAAFLAYAALLSNDEDMRKHVATLPLVRRLADALSSDSRQVRVTSLQCLLSLSRSVQILRTLFEDCEVWKPVMEIAQRSDPRRHQQAAAGAAMTSSSSSEAETTSSTVDDEELTAVSALLCNLAIEFSPCASKLLAANLLPLLKRWCDADHVIGVRRNAVWAFLNITFQADLKMKLDVMSLLGADLLFSLVTSNDYDVITKTMGVLNNVLTNSQHADTVMTMHGDVVMQACAVVVEMTSFPAPIGGAGAPLAPGRDAESAVRTYAACAIGCVCAVRSPAIVRRHVLDNDDLLRKLMEFLERDDVELRTASVQCFNSLLCNSTEQHHVEVRDKLAGLGLVDAMRRARSPATPSLTDRVNAVLKFF